LDIITLLIPFSKVVVTDYPDESLVDNMRFNISENMGKEDLVRVDVQACKP
jgi:hypothetical protein